MIEHYLQLDGANVVNTANFALALENMRYVRRRHAISLFFGDPGVGKTIAAQAIAESFDQGAGCVVKLTTGPNPRMIANAILEKLTGVFHAETRWEAARTLTHELRERPRMVIIDEAQNAGLDCIDLAALAARRGPRPADAAVRRRTAGAIPRDEVAAADAEDLPADRVPCLARGVGARDDPLLSPDVRGGR